MNIQVVMRQQLHLYNSMELSEGTLTLADGTKYTGQFLEDRKDGQGIQQWADGRKYDGNWLDGMQHGKGAYTDTEGVTKQGMWENGTRTSWIE